MAVATAKTCTRCGQEKPLEEFSRGMALHGRRSRCKGCCVQEAQDYHRRHPDWALGYRLRTKFNLTLQDYHKFWEEQDGKCAICSREFLDVCEDRRRPSVDHDHQTGRVRGLLCFNCNTGIGKLSEDVQVLRAAIQYLEKHHG
jgi:Autographiviridae endonuclease VII